MIPQSRPAAAIDRESASIAPGMAETLGQDAAGVPSPRRAVCQPGEGS